MGEKVLCRIAKMTAAAINARDWASKLVQREARGPGDMENAMRRLEQRYGIPWRTFWRLRYRPPADLLVSVYERLGAAYQAECERQEGLLRHEREITKAKTAIGKGLVGAADFVAGEETENLITGE